MSRKKNFVPVEQHRVALVNELKILGDIFDSKSDWNAHVNCVIKCVLQHLFFIRLLKSHVNQEETCTAFNSLVRSTLKYCQTLFIDLSKYKATKLEKTLSRFHRLMC